MVQCNYPASGTAARRGCSDRLESADGSARRCLQVAGGALGMELVGGFLTDTGGQATLAYLDATTTEESLEMLGVVIFIYALLDYIRRRLPALRVDLRSDAAA